MACGSGRRSPGYWPISLSLVLMDEPFGALDAQTREVMQMELDQIWRATRPTIVFITHDIWEAILLADRVITMTARPTATFKTVSPIGIEHPARVDITCSRRAVSQSARRYRGRGEKDAAGARPGSRPRHEQRQRRHAAGDAARETAGQARRHRGILQQSGRPLVDGIRLGRRGRGGLRQLLSMRLNPLFLPSPRLTLAVGSNCGMTARSSNRSGRRLPASWPAGRSA